MTTKLKSYNRGTSKKNTAIGSFIMACMELSKKRGGKQKVQIIAGKKIFYQGQIKSKWFFNNKAICALSAKKLDELREKIENA